MKKDPVSCPPESMRPDRDEVITALADIQPLELQSGVSFEPLVGSFNKARDLTTGLVTFQPNAVLDYHRHPCSESITVLDGEIEVSVEGRAYRLGILDNIVIPRWAPHSAVNHHAASNARLHAALAMGVPERELVTQTFGRSEMAGDSTGVSGFERVTRFASAKRTFDVGPGAEFVDFFNASLMPGIEMSGGHGRFQPTGRLPAHFHDFDESICITSGVATCIVEGRHYSLSECSTAMVPRGRVHYFVNNSETSMDMIWVYAGPMPERIVVDSKCATKEGNPWR